MKAFYCDVETTGLDHKRHAIIELAGLISIDGKVVETVDYKLVPAPWQDITLGALEVTGHTIEQFNDYELPKDVYNKFAKTLSKYVNKFDKKDKFTFIGYNAKFDTEFIRQFMTDNGDKYSYGSHFWHPSIDVATLVAYKLARAGEREKIENTKLVTAAKYFGIEVDESKAHGAMYDIRLTLELLKKVGK